MSLRQNTVIYMDGFYFSYYFHRLSLLFPQNDYAYKLGRNRDSNQNGNR